MERPRVPWNVPTGKYAAPPSAGFHPATPRSSMQSNILTIMVSPQWHFLPIRYNPFEIKLSFLQSTIFACSSNMPGKNDFTALKLLIPYDLVQGKIQKIIEMPDTNV
jgi:hypothetical protein